MDDDPDPARAEGPVLRAIRRAIGRSPIQRAPTIPLPGRHYAIPQHLVEAAAQAVAQEDARRKRGLVTSGAVGVDYQRFGAALRAPDTDVAAVPEAAPADEAAPVCTTENPSGRFGWLRTPARLGLAGITLLATIGLTGVGMTLGSTSAPAYEAAAPGAAPGLLAVGLGGRSSDAPTAPDRGGASDSLPPIASTTTAADTDGAVKAASDPAPGATGDAAAGTTPVTTPVTTTATTTGAAPTATDSTEIAGYPSFSSGTPPGSAPSGSTSTAGSGTDRTAPTSVGLGGYSGGAIPASRFANAVTLATTSPSVAGVTPSDSSTGGSTSGTSPTGNATSGGSGSGTTTTDTSGPGGLTSDGSTPGGSTLSPSAGGTSPQDGGAGSTVPTPAPGGAGTSTDATPLVTALGPPNIVLPEPGTTPCCVVPQTAVNQLIDLPEPAASVLLVVGAAATLAGRRRR